MNDYIEFETKAAPCDIPADELATGQQGVITQLDSGSATARAGTAVVRTNEGQLLAISGDDTGTVFDLDTYRVRPANFRLIEIE